ncbi:MAG: hypothetical protein ACFFAO_12450 [Candidatus Hermodarchaeota archaeon]
MHGPFKLKNGENLFVAPSSGMQFYGDKADDGIWIYRHLFEGKEKLYKYNSWLWQGVILD